MKSNNISVILFVLLLAITLMSNIIAQTTYHVWRSPLGKIFNEGGDAINWISSDSPEQHFWAIEIGKENDFRAEFNDLKPSFQSIINDNAAYRGDPDEKIVNGIHDSYYWSEFEDFKWYTTPGGSWDDQYNQVSTWQAPTTPGGVNISFRVVDDQSKDGAADLFPIIDWNTFPIDEFYVNIYNVSYMPLYWYGITRDTSENLKPSNLSYYLTSSRIEIQGLPENGYFKYELSGASSSMVHLKKNLITGNVIGPIQGATWVEVHFNQLNLDIPPANNVFVRIYYKPQGNYLFRTIKTVEIPVIWPIELMEANYLNLHKPHPNPNIIGWWSELHYIILTNKLSVLWLEPLPYAESWTSGPYINDPINPPYGWMGTLGGPIWGEAGGAFTRNPRCPNKPHSDKYYILDDVVRTVGSSPPLQYPGSPLGNVQINWMAGEWSIGSTIAGDFRLPFPNNLGEGIKVQSNHWQIYQDHGLHTNIITPVL